MLKGKTKDEATKYMKDQATNAAETRAKDFFRVLRSHLTCFGSLPTFFRA